MKYYIYDKEKDDFVKDEGGERVCLSSQKEVYDYLKAEGLNEHWIVTNFSLVRMFKIFPVEELPEFFENMQEEPQKKQPYGCLKSKRCLAAFREFIKQR